MLSVLCWIIAEQVHAIDLPRDVDPEGRSHRREDVHRLRPVVRRRRARAAGKLDEERDRGHLPDVVLGDDSTERPAA